MLLKKDKRDIYGLSLRLPQPIFDSPTCLPVSLGSYFLCPYGATERPPPPPLPQPPFSKPPLLLLQCRETDILLILWVAAETSIRAEGAEHPRGKVNEEACRIKSCGQLLVCGILQPISYCALDIH